MKIVMKSRKEAPAGIVVGGTDADSVNDCELPEDGETVIVTEYDVTIVFEL